MSGDPGRRIVLRHPVNWAGYGTSAYLTDLYIATNESGQSRFVFALGDDVPQDLIDKLDPQDLAELNRPVDAAGP